ncbi:hypothetical protein ACB035_10340 [Aeromonas sp. S12(2024)]|uniref:hypothetical protein n=1 Tax=Aeromonas sp. S12(2024) TaxID=3242885 RepID=UPI003528CC8B
MHEMIDVHPLSLTAEDTPFASPPSQKVLLHTPSGILGGASNGWGEQLSSEQGWPWTLLPIAGEANQFYLQCPLGYMGWKDAALIRANAPLSERKIFDFMPAPEAADAFVLRMKDPGSTYHDRYVRCKTDNGVDLVVDPTQATCVRVRPLQQVRLQTQTGVLGTDTLGRARFDQEPQLWSLLPIAGSAGKYHLHGDKGYMGWQTQGVNRHVITNAAMADRKIFEFVPVPEAADTFLLRMAQPGDTLSGLYVQQRSDHWAVLTADAAHAARLTRIVELADTTIDTVIRDLAISEDELDMLLQEPPQSSVLGLPPAYLLNLGYGATISKQKVTPTAVQPRWKLVRDGQPLDAQTLQRMEMLVLLQRQMAISYRQLDELFAIALLLDDPDKILTTVSLLRKWQLAGADFTSWYQWLTTSLATPNDMWYRLMTMALLPSLTLAPESFDGLWGLLSTSRGWSIRDIATVYEFLKLSRQRQWSIAWLTEILTPSHGLPLLQTEAYYTRIAEWKAAVQPALVKPIAIQHLQVAQVNRMLKDLDSSLSPIDWWPLCMSSGATDATGLIKLTLPQLATFSLSTQLNAHPTTQALIAKGSPEARAIQTLLQTEQHAIENYIKQAGEQQHNALIRLALQDALPAEFMTPLLNWLGLAHYTVMHLLHNASEGAPVQKGHDSLVVAILYDLSRYIELVKPLSLRPTFLNKIVTRPELIGLKESDRDVLVLWLGSLVILDDMVRDNPAQWEAALDQGLPMNTVALLLGINDLELTSLVLELGGSVVVRSLSECLHIYQLIQLSKDLRIPANFLVLIFNARNGESTMSQQAAVALRDTMQFHKFQGNIR